MDIDSRLPSLVATLAELSSSNLYQNEYIGYYWHIIMAHISYQVQTVTEPLCIHRLTNPNN